MDLPQQLEKGKEKLKPHSGAHLNFALKRPSPETGRSLGNVTNSNVLECDDLEETLMSDPDVESKVPRGNSLTAHPPPTASDHRRWREQFVPWCARSTDVIGELWWHTHIPGTFDFQAEE
ncbi:hypothetical protein QQF64_011231 [Cirrhinus molitorella]|uniref:Uncharacterized protein n=1 Tax=Cirrhinus molitorella TaxID=172907 RepID=A0ABR3LYM6_9TELE